MDSILPKGLVAALILVAFAAPAEAAAPSPRELRQGLIGSWSGALGYRDYQTDKLFELPVKTRFSSVGDGATLISVSEFDDGPSTGIVYITTLELDDETGGTVASSSARRGKPSELSAERVRVTAFVDLTHWTLVYDERGSDDDKPADLRVTQTRDGDHLTSVKEVRTLPSTAATFSFRNRTRLTRVPSL